MARKATYNGVCRSDALLRANRIAHVKHWRDFAVSGASRTCSGNIGINRPLKRYEYYDNIEVQLLDVCYAIGNFGQELIFPPFFLLLEIPQMYVGNGKH